MLLNAARAVGKDTLTTPEQNDREACSKPEQYGHRSLTTLERYGRPILVLFQYGSGHKEAVGYAESIHQPIFTRSGTDTSTLLPIEHPNAQSFPIHTLEFLISSIARLS